MFEHSIDRLRDLFEDAQARRIKETARAELSLLTSVRLAYMSCRSKDGVKEFNRTVRELYDIANGIEPKEKPADLRSIAEKIVSLGGKRAYHPPKLKTK